MVCTDVNLQSLDHRARTTRSAWWLLIHSSRDYRDHDAMRDDAARDLEDSRVRSSKMDVVRFTIMMTWLGIGFRPMAGV